MGILIRLLIRFMQSEKFYYTDRKNTVMANSLFWSDGGLSFATSIMPMYSYGVIVLVCAYNTKNFYVCVVIENLYTQHNNRQNNQ